MLTILRIAAGIILLMLGIIGLVVPIIQGWLLIFIAIPIISPAHGKKMVAKAKEWKEKLKRKYQNSRKIGN